MNREGDSEHRRFLAEAVELGVASVARGGGPFGALVVRDGEVVGTGVNRVTADCDPTAHAEIVAIRAACRRLDSFQLEGCDVYSSTEPCPMCMAALYWARPRRVFFASDRRDAAAAGFDDQFIYDELGRSPETREIETTQIDIREAGEEFRAWRGFGARIEY